MGYGKLRNNVITDDDTVKLGFVENIKNSVIICDEIHNAYATE